MCRIVSSLKSLKASQEPSYHISGSFYNLFYNLPQPHSKILSSQVYTVRTKKCAKHVPWGALFSSVEVKMIFMCSEKPGSRLSDVSRALLWNSSSDHLVNYGPSVSFQANSPSVFSFHASSLLQTICCAMYVLSFVPAGSGSNFSKLPKHLPRTVDRSVFFVDGGTAGYTDDA